MSQAAINRDVSPGSLPNEQHWHELPELRTNRAAGWSAENFGRQQLQGLVRQLFITSPSDKPVRQVVFSAIDRETHIGSLPQRVGELLALEKTGKVAVMARYPGLTSGPLNGNGADYRFDASALSQPGFRLRENLWLVSTGVADGVSVTPKLQTSICELRRQFDYSILEGPIADSQEALAMAQLADGVVLVLSARHTRRATARSVKHSLESANARILGTVLLDRDFPIPDRIYRRL